MTELKTAEERSDRVALVAEEEIRAAEDAAFLRGRAEALKEAATIAEGYAHYAAGSPSPEHGGFKDPTKLVDQAVRIAWAIRAREGP